MFPADVVAEISSRHQLHHEVQCIPILKCMVHIHNEFMLQSSQEVPLVSDGFVTLFGEDTGYLQSYTALDISFIANSCPVFFSLTLNTFPNPPFPITLRYS